MDKPLEDASYLFLPEWDIRPVFAFDFHIKNKSS